MHVCTNLCMLEYAPMHRHNYMSVCVGMCGHASWCRHEYIYVCVCVYSCMSETEHEMSNDR